MICRPEVGRGLHTFTDGAVNGIGVIGGDLFFIHCFLFCAPLGAVNVFILCRCSGVPYLLTVQK